MCAFGESSPCGATTAATVAARQRTRKGCHFLTAHAGSPSRWRTSASVTPVICSVFRRDVRPATTRTLADGIPRAAATTRSTATLACPRSAGARTRTFSVSPSQPARASQGDEGATLTASLIGSSSVYRGPPRATLDRWGDPRGARRYRRGGLMKVVNGRRVAPMLLAVLLVLAVGTDAGQDAPRTPWGAPNLQGVWDFKTATPLERPEDRGEQSTATSGSGRRRPAAPRPGAT